MALVVPDQHVGPSALMGQVGSGTLRISYAASSAKPPDQQLNETKHKKIGWI